MVDYKKVVELQSRLEQQAKKLKYLEQLLAQEQSDKESLQVDFQHAIDQLRAISLSEAAIS